ncbi:MAG: DUF4147 domain-containing protein [Phycisphaerales bacterium]|nr:DUF4147 domain-containing protein [Phycisphaerales bacterium]
MNPRFEDHHRHAEAIIAAVLEAADPAATLARAWPGELDDGARATVIAIGKASLEMARAAMQRLGPALAGGVVIAVPERAGDTTHIGPLRVVPADHPWPTERNVAAAREVEVLAHGIRPGERVIVLISGGGSAHLTLPAGAISLEDLAAVTRALQRAGAPIQDLNAVRKHAERLKGGRLGVLLARADVRVFVLSDVMGDRLDVIASGPAAPDPTTYGDAIALLEYYRAAGTAPAVAEHLRRGARGELEETPKPGDPRLAAIRHTIIANNSTAVEAAARAGRKLGFEVVEVRLGVEGDAASAGRWLAARLREVTAARPGPVAVVLGGETTVDVQAARGTGGPSQELALAAAIELDGEERMAVLAFSSDGVDGPTDAAGAIVTGRARAQARERGVDLRESLSGHDSHGSLGAIGALVRTGPTGTNVNHIAIGLGYGRI